MLQRQTGFTLLELLVALAVFSVMASMAYSGLNGLIQNRERLAAATGRLGQLQLAMDTLSRDLSQLVARPVRDELGDPRPALASFPGRFDLEFTRGGWPNPLSRPRSHLQRVVYRFEGGELVRYGARVLDGGARGDSDRRVMLGDMKSFDVRLMDGLGEWQNGWPVGPETAMPRAVRVEMELADWGRITRVFPVETSNRDDLAEPGS